MTSLRLLVSEKHVFTNYSTIVQEKKILNKKIKIMFKTIGSAKDVKRLFGFCVSITHNSKYVGPTAEKSVWHCF